MAWLNYGTEITFLPTWYYPELSLQILTNAVKLWHNYESFIELTNLIKKLIFTSV